MSMKALCFSAVTVPVLLSVDEELLVFLKSFSRKLAQALEDEEKATSPSSENRKHVGGKWGRSLQKYCCLRAYIAWRAHLGSLSSKKVGKRQVTCLFLQTFHFSVICFIFRLQVLLEHIRARAWQVTTERLMLGCFEAMVKIPFSSSDCKVTVYLVALQCLIIGAGPCGLRTAIDLSFLGAKVVVIEKRDAFSRNNVLHLWPFTIHDLRGLGAKKFYGKFCAGSIDHISKYSRC